ncbi:methyltransferase type 11 [Pandoraea cepalis]|uniref:Methyltransferase type 11 n=2 Tax=Pandoraea cepalis TaxID=2508294 RepID=A0AAW7MGQ8_9BURK|nr:DUF3560 domain-containing protein [Burkholderia vietnamiensis]MDN4571836.1 methyltransferase type 11 [Pandoraea cepalis]MDN4576852.1 methyltransferase type 11 [Pandoraea cepalis]
MQVLTATYSPEDNKLRIYSATRLDRELYDRLARAGFKRAPKQDCFVAPMWTPEREDLAIELCGELGDEDMSLAQRAEERAERFDGYRANRTADAEHARAAVAAIADGIPLGQPILVGHHSERHARKDAERIENGMRRAVQMWDTADYWKRRAQGALLHASYRERPDVRHRRIKTLEADQRRNMRDVQEAEQFMTRWQADGLTIEQAVQIANCDHVTIRQNGESYGTSVYTLLTQGTFTAEQAAQACIRCHERVIRRARRWLQHIEHRLTYERAMLDESGGVVSDRFDIQPGGRVLAGREWLVVLRVNRANGRINSVTTNAPASVHWRKNWRYGVEEVIDYRAPEAEDAAKVKAANKLPPLVNHPGEGFIEMTADEWKRRPNDYKGTRRAAATAEHGAYRFRTSFVPGGTYRTAQVFITDAKRIDPPATVPDAQPAPSFERDIVTDTPARAAIATAAREPDPYRGMREQLRAGVQVVSAPQLFPTPAPLAARMVEIAGIESGHAVLEPSAGTGRILDALNQVHAADGLPVTAIEINRHLADALTARFPQMRTICRDFLECGDELETFDRILMNPPFVQAQDIEHIRHALKFLKPGGQLVAICANGPRQAQQLRPLAEDSGGIWEPLPADTFSESGTGVHAVLLTIER